MYVPKIIDLIFSTNCNQKCYHCYFKDTSNEELTFDIDKLNILKDITCKRINISGGEPGLINNLPDIIHWLKSNDFYVSLLSNGLVRKKFPEIINIVDSYQEHLVYRIIQGKLHKFYDMPLLTQSNSKNVIILLPETLLFLEKNPKFFLLRNRKNILWKLYNVKNTDFPIDSDYYDRVKKLLYNNQIYMPNGLTTTDFELSRKTCSENFNRLTIRFDNNKIYHCAYCLHISNYLPLCRDNLISPNFGITDYCNTCFSFTNE